MQFLKKHFEKIILSAVLLGLAAAAFWMSMAVTQARSDAAAPGGAAGREKPWAGVDLTAQRAALKNLKEVPTFILTGEHNLFNPVVWKMRKDGFPFKVLTGGPTAIAVTDIQPFYFTINLMSQAGEGYYMVSQPAEGPKKKQEFAKVGEKPTPTKPFTILSASGTNGAQGEALTLQLKIPETGGTVSVTQDKPYKRVEGYDASMTYSAPDDRKVLNKKKVGEILPLSGESYKIVAIASNNITVQDTRTQKRTTIEWSGGH